eukprot:TRINITY_DN39090_c0_g1_i1.p1 TRINITY_DN39090_c0_g1~~TRINITY_DN39090_c0_g1_i1.p1  ORF type:complete len:363 (-),score=41.77 TRINITY_DN39090_c0_g1_i1:12-1100(-)
MNLANQDDVDGQYTTIMLRNIPGEYTQDELLLEVREALGMALLFDFFYLPWDAQGNCNTGYCFVNFVSTSFAKRAMKVLTRYLFKLHCGNRKGAVSWARVQGLDNNLKRFKVRSMAFGKCSPVVMSNEGQKIPLNRLIEEIRVQETLRKSKSDDSPRACSDLRHRSAKMSMPAPALTEGGAGSFEAENIYYSSANSTCSTHGLPGSCTLREECAEIGMHIRTRNQVYIDSTWVTPVLPPSSPMEHEVPWPFMAPSCLKPGQNPLGFQEPILSGQHAQREARGGRAGNRQTMAPMSQTPADYNHGSSPTIFPGSFVPSLGPGRVSELDPRHQNSLGLETSGQRIMAAKTKDADRALLRDFLMI